MTPCKKCEDAYIALRAAVVSTNPYSLAIYGASYVRSYDAHRRGEHEEAGR